MENKFLKTDAGSHFFDCLYFVERQLELVLSNLKEWHWAIIGLASLTQSSCVLFLDERDTAQLSTLSKKSMKKTLEAIEHNSLSSMPLPYMAPPIELIDRVLNSNGQNLVLGNSQTKVLLSESSLSDLRKVFVLRNEFMHFTPMIWSLELVGLPRISREVIMFCMQVLETPGLYQRLSSENREEAKRICGKLVLSCEKMNEALLET